MPARRRHPAAPQADRRSAAGNHRFLLTPFAAYLLPEHLGGSGILATVAAGMYIGERLSDVVPAGTRLHSTSVWEVVVFLLNGVLFLVAGIQLRRVIQPEYLNEEYLKYGLIISATVIGLRVAWCASAWRLLPWRARVPARHMLITAWAGMRGPISLAAALSIPVFAKGVRPPHLETLVFITAIVIVVTLVIQGIALPFAVKVLGVARDAEKIAKKSGVNSRWARPKLQSGAGIRLAPGDGGPDPERQGGWLFVYYSSRPKGDSAADGSDARTAR